MALIVSPLSWLGRHKVRSYLRQAIWVGPALAILAALIGAQLLAQVEQSLELESKPDAGTALVLLGSLASSMFTFIVFVSSALLLAVQLASAQLTPRIITYLFQDRVVKLATALFVFTFTFTLAVLVRIRTDVPMLSTRIAAYSSLASLAVFLYVINHMGMSLRTNGALRSIGRVGRKIITDVYPRPAEVAASSPKSSVLTGPPLQTILSQKDGAVLLFNATGLLAIAQRHDCVIEIIPQVGDSVAAGDPLFHIRAGGQRLMADDLLQLIAIGPDRTFEQDPALAFRVIVDIACKALSPAVNDPTTAVLAIDELHHLLRHVGKRNLDNRLRRDSRGEYRLAYRTPDWQDFVSLAITEIRLYGGDSIQVVRRLRAMLENLLQTLPEMRAEPLRRELSLLARSAQRLFADPEDRAMAQVSDPQGVGGRNADEAGQVPVENALPLASTIGEGAR